MSLCPNYCDCGACKHGKKFCSEAECWECVAEYTRVLAQIQHEESVRRQRAKLKPLAGKNTRNTA